jgi:xylulokinase
LYLGIDLGTSAVKTVLVDDQQRVVDQESVPMGVQRPHPLWSEQDPEQWWLATGRSVAGLRSRRARELRSVRGIGLSGQMHGATLLDAGDRVLRPAVLWNDGRSAAECRELEARVPESREITGNLAMPGFTAPKLLWVARNEPEIFRRVAKVLLPKDLLRLRLCGEHATDCSDAAGTLWLDVARRTWSERMLGATGLDLETMPQLHEGSEPTGTLRSEIASDWGLPSDAIVAGGAGDQAAGAVGAGVVEPGQALLSLGTSGVYFVAGRHFAPNPASAIHAFCHCLPERWHQMSVMLSAASCLSWASAVTGFGSGGEGALLAEVEADDRDPGPTLFLPYLSGERTPHNDPRAMGVFFGLSHDTRRADLGRAVLEGIAFALADGQAALVAGGSRIERVSVIGGGARSVFWGRILASALDRPLGYAAGAELGPAFGAARLGRLACTGESSASVCTAPTFDRVIEPDPDLQDRLIERYRIFRRLYRSLRERFAEAGSIAT